MKTEPLVLLVDDDVNARSGYAELLEARGFRVLVAGSSAEALTLAVARVPDVVVTDIALPGSDGFTLACDLRDHPAVGSVPILAMTAYWAIDLHARAERAGITAIIAKPCQPDHLVAELRRALGTAAQAAQD